MSELNAPMPGDSKSKSDPFPDPPVRSGPGLRESVALMALMVSLVALSIDGILPALPAIGRDLGVERGNANQLIITMLFLGMAIGQIFYGPLSDSTGRKPAIYLGFFFFFTGSLLCLLATSFQVMLAGRALQGIGAAGPRAVTTALIRDQYEGRAMARVNSFVLAVFILVPIFAPALGQGILMLTHWRGIFGLFLMLAAVAATWFHFRQPETLSPTQRIPFSPKKILSAVGAVFASRVAVGYSLAMGFVYGSFIGYLSSTQQIFQIQYGLGARFPLVFAIFALSIGTASLCNGPPGPPHWHEATVNPVPSDAYFTFHRLLADCLRPRGASAAVVPDGLHDHCLSLHRSLVWESSCSGHGAVGSYRRNGIRRRNDAVDFPFSPAGNLYRPELQQYHTSTYWRIRGP